MTKRNVTQWYRYDAWCRKLKLNRRYKDVLFRKIFYNKQDFSDLYNAFGYME